MEQELFAWDEREEPASPVRKVYTWNWWDPWPKDLTIEQCYCRQIARDERALDEADTVWMGEWEKEFFRNRIISFKDALMKMGSDKQSAQPPPATAPGDRP